jgi:hypothetical protein
MSSAPMLDKVRVEGWADEEVVRRVLAGDTILFELLMRRHNNASTGRYGASFATTRNVKT